MSTKQQQPGTRTVFRSSVTGRFTTQQRAERSPATHERERVRTATQRRPSSK